MYEAYYTKENVQIKVAIKTIKGNYYVLFLLFYNCCNIMNAMYKWTGGGSREGSGDGWQPKVGYTFH